MKSIKPSTIALIATGTAIVALAITLAVTAPRSATENWGWAGAWCGPTMGVWAGQVQAGQDGTDVPDDTAEYREWYRGARPMRPGRHGGGAQFPAAFLIGAGLGCLALRSSAKKREKAEEK